MVNLIELEKSPNIGNLIDKLTNLAIPISRIYTTEIYGNNQVGYTCDEIIIKRDDFKKCSYKVQNCLYINYKAAQQFYFGKTTPQRSTF